MTKELELHANGTISVVFGKEYLLPRPKFGQRNKIQDKISGLGDSIQAVSLKVIEDIQNEFGLSEDEIDKAAAGGDVEVKATADLDPLEVRAKVLEALQKLDETTFIVLFGIWSEIIEILSGEKPDIGLDEAPLWVGQTDVLEAVAEHWSSNPLASSPNPPTLTVVQ